MGNLHTIFGEMVAKSIGLQDAVMGEGRICDAGTEIVSGRKRLELGGQTNSPPRCRRSRRV